MLDRDTISLALQHVDQQTVAGTENTVEPSTTSTSVTAAWTRELSERATLTGSVSYGMQNLASTPAEQANFVSFSAQYRYKFTDTPAGSANYLFYNRHSNTPGVSIYEDIALVGITKEFCALAWENFRSVSSLRSTAASSQPGDLPRGLCRQHHFGRAVIATA